MIKRLLLAMLLALSLCSCGTENITKKFEDSCESGKVEITLYVNPLFASMSARCLLND